MTADGESFVVECFWPDVEDADLVALDRRIGAVVAESAADGAVRYLGSILLRDDEVVLCQFTGPIDRVREVVERAAIPFDRILAARSQRGPAETLTAPD